MNMNGLRGELSYNIDRQLNIILERNLQALYPRRWLQRQLHRQMASVLMPNAGEQTTAKLDALGHLFLVDLRGHVLVQLAAYLKPLRNATAYRWQTRQEILKDIPCPKPDFALEMLQGPAQGDAQPNALHPLRNNGYWMIWNDLNLFNTAMTDWLDNRAPKLYQRDLVTRAFILEPEEYNEHTPETKA